MERNFAEKKMQSSRKNRISCAFCASSRLNDFIFFVTLRQIFFGSVQVRYYSEYEGACDIRYT